MNLNIFNVYNKSKSESAGPTEIDYKRINVYQNTNNSRTAKNNCRTGSIIP